MRILVVEDDHKLGTLLREGLGEEGFDVLWVKTGEEGIARAVGEAWDLLLLDYMLPTKNGREVAMEVRSAGRLFPILMLTARDSAEDLEEALRSGVSDLMGKPFRFAELVDRIVRLTSTPAAG
ncbi:MAG TPA: response regulator [Gemmatimonadales bacterium]|jgi:DNA-binding response OmpR family regulator